MARDVFNDTTGTAVVSGWDGTQSQKLKTKTDGTLVTADSTSPYGAALTPSGVVQATAAGAVIAANGTRQLIEIVNTSDTDVWLTLATTGAAANQGIYLSAWGGSWSGYYAGAITAIHNNTRQGQATTGANKPVGYVEF